MLISVLGLGSIWSTRPAQGNKGAAHFNTTGVLASGKYRHRSCIYGHIRIDECTGFHPDQAYRWLSRVHETEGLVTWNGKRKLFLQKPVPTDTIPDRHLIRISSDEIGWIETRSMDVRRRGGRFIQRRQRPAGSPRFIAGVWVA